MFANDILTSSDITVTHSLPGIAALNCDPEQYFTGIRPTLR
jgi:hypothetical protein